MVSVPWQGHHWAYVLSIHFSLNKQFFHGCFISISLCIDHLSSFRTQVHSLQVTCMSCSTVWVPTASINIKFYLVELLFFQYINIIKFKSFFLNIYSIFFNNFWFGLVLRTWYGTSNLVPRSTFLTSDIYICMYYY